MLDVATLNYTLALGTLALQAGTVLLFLAYLLRNRSTLCAGLIGAVRTHVLWIAFILSFLGAGLTLVYSDILGFEPCALCWWQRIFLYPQVILFGLALWKRGMPVALYPMILSGIGFCVALYHHALQTLPSGTLPCPAQGVSCAQRLIFEFGYVTFPMMAVALFGALFVLLFVTRSENPGK
jgi:disulfide bond formation protein DsbB